MGGSCIHQQLLAEAGLGVSLETVGTMLLVVELRVYPM